MSALAPVRDGRVCSGGLAAVLLSQRSDGRDFGEVTGLLRAWSEGDKDAFERVLPFVYDELHRMAARDRIERRT